MKITRSIVKSVKQACSRVCGGRRSVEVGFRSWVDMISDSAGCNFLLWGSGHDLDYTEKIDSLIGTEVDDDAGWVAFDCYCYNLPVFGRESDDALDCNVYVLINPAGEVCYASQDDMRYSHAVNDILVAAGHPGYRNQE